jgi:predicted CXXCH cytochrome family protein
MKKLFMFAMVLALVAGFSTGAFAVITGSAHDLSGAGLGTNELCKFCHIPHFPQPGGGGAPLWNRADTASQGSFTLYDGSTLASVSGSSIVCLSCHDGVTNLDAYGGNAGTTTIGPAGDLGVDLQNDHPVSMTYPADGTNYRVTPTNGVDARIEGGNVECGTCHDPHLTDNTNFLFLSNAQSALCTSCHLK